jgi:type 1 glutamine amidotransferase
MGYRFFHPIFRFPFLFFFLALGSCWTSPLQGQNQTPDTPPRTINALILSGYNNHDWRTSTPLLKKFLLDSGRFTVRVTEEPSGLNKAVLARYDVLILDYVGPRWGAQAEEAVTAFVEEGKGLVVIHGANYSFAGMEVLGDGHKPTGLKESPWPQFLQMVGGYWTSSEPKTGHGKRHSFEVSFSDPEHPIAKGLAPKFIGTDELYHQPRMQPQAHVIARAFSKKETNGTGKEEPILWTVPYGKGRVFYTALGHDAVAMNEIGFIGTFLRGAEWVATGSCSIPFPQKLYAVPKDAKRVLVVTGGHSYEPSFYTLFEDPSAIDWSHAYSAAEAFKKDLRPQFDVLVLYDMTPEISPEARNNLVQFLESGKGLIVLHHALADYQSWSWWYRDVVGGRYLMKPEENLPGSTYLHDVELFITTATQHPVLQGLGPMHFVDETYKGVWHSPDITPLLKTNHPTSDEVVAWISPYSKSRVVAIQLGHDRQAHLYPGYRQLIRNALQWVSSSKP